LSWVTSVNEAARHYDEPQLASLILYIAMTNVWNRLNVTIKQVAGEWAKLDEARKWKEKQREDEKEKQIAAD
jgi:hypothetical protein